VHYDLWAILFASALATGASIVSLLTSTRNKEPLGFLAGLITMAISTWAISSLVETYARFEIALYAGLLAAAAAVGGYGLASSLLPLYASKEVPPSPIDIIVPGDERVTVLVAAVLEPEQYDPGTVAATLADMAQAGLPEATMGIMPFLFAAQKARYRAAGGKSPSIRAARDLTERLEGMLDSERFGPVELITCADDDTLDAAVGRAARRGATNIVTDAGLRVVYTPPLWGSEALAEEIARRIWVGRDAPEKTGVALVMHGQPETREKTHGVFDVHENAFCNRIRMFLTERGIPEANIRLCYLDWRDPEVTETIRHLAALGCSRVIVMPACFPFESVTTILDLRVAARQARVETHVHTLIMQPWGDDETIAEVLATLVTEAEKDLRG